MTRRPSNSELTVGLSLEDRLEGLLDPEIARPISPTMDLLILLEVHGVVQVVKIGEDGRVVHAKTSSSEGELASKQWYACPREAIVEALHGNAATKENLRQVLAWISAISWRSHAGREYESFMELGYYQPDPKAIHYLPRLSEAARLPRKT